MPIVAHMAAEAAAPPAHADCDNKAVESLSRNDRWGDNDAVITVSPQHPPVGLQERIDVVEAVLVRRVMALSTVLRPLLGSLDTVKRCLDETSLGTHDEDR